MLAAVIPFPREEVTPPVTKTYFATDQDLRGFFECYRSRPPEARRSGASGGHPRVQPPNMRSPDQPFGASPMRTSGSAKGGLRTLTVDLLQVQRSIRVRGPAKPAHAGGAT